MDVKTDLGNLITESIRLFSMLIVADMVCWLRTLCPIEIPSYNYYQYSEESLNIFTTGQSNYIKQLLTLSNVEEKSQCERYLT